MIILKKAFISYFMIEINNLTVFSIDEEILRRIAKRVLKGENKRKSNLSIALLGPSRMRQINKRYRGKNRTTDVLAFPETKILKEKFKTGSLKKIENLGEIVICLREVKKNAKKFGSTFEKELNRVLIHGILHLLGYDHEKSEEAAKKMKEKEEFYLSQI